MRTPMSKAVGIGLGPISSAIAAWQGGEAAVITMANPLSAGSPAGRRSPTPREPSVGFDIAPAEHGNARFNVRDKVYAPEEITTLVLRKLADAAGNA